MSRARLRGALWAVVIASPGGARPGAEAMTRNPPPRRRRRPPRQTTQATQPSGDDGEGDVSPEGEDPTPSDTGPHGPETGVGSREEQDTEENDTRRPRAPPSSSNKSANSTPRSAIERLSDPRRGGREAERAGIDLPRLSAAWDRQQRLQREPRAGARATRPRRPPDVPDRGAESCRGSIERVTGKGESSGVSPAEPEAGRVHPGTVTAYVPDIGGLLPVYVRPLRGFEVKTFAELTDEELDAYIAANVAAARDVGGGWGRRGAREPPRDGPADPRPRRAAIRPPSTEARSSSRGPNPLPSSRRGGMRAAAAVLVGSRHTAESLWATLERLDLPARTRLGRPGWTRGCSPPRPPAAPSPRCAARGRDLDRGTGEWGRDARGRLGAGSWAAADGPGDLRRKADRLQGTRPAARGVAAGVRANPGARLLVIAFGQGRR